MLPFFLSTLAAASLVTACNPTTTTCPSIPAMPSSVTYDLSTTDTTNFDYVMSTRIVANGSSLQFSVAEQGDAPTLITNDYLLYGNVKATVKSAPGVGMVSAFILMSDVADEIDLEWLGAYDYEVQTNYYYRGETSGYDRGGVTNVTKPEEATHVYEIDWTETTLQWLVDGVVVRTLDKSDTTGYGYPDTPCQIKIGVWASGDPTNAAGTIEWGGGLIDYTAGPYTMTLSSLAVTSYTTAKSFSYTDNGTTVVISQNAVSSSASSAATASASATGNAGLAAVKQASASSTTKTAVTSSSKTQNAVASGVTTASRSSSTGAVAVAATGAARVTASSSLATTKKATGSSVASAAVSSGTTLVSTSASSILATSTAFILSMCAIIGLLIL